MVPGPVCRGEVGYEGTGQRVLAGAGHRVADAGAGDKGSEAAQRLLVGEQFTEERPERFGGRVLSAPQFHDLPVEPAGLRGLPQPGLPLQYQRPHAS